MTKLGHDNARNELSNDSEGTLSYFINCFLEQNWQIQPEDSDAPAKVNLLAPQWRSIHPQFSNTERTISLNEVREAQDEVL